MQILIFPTHRRGNTPYDVWLGKKKNRHCKEYLFLDAVEYPAPLLLFWPVKEYSSDFWSDMLSKSVPKRALFTQVEQTVVRTHVTGLSGVTDDL